MSNSVLVTGLNHTSYTVRDIDRLLNFFVEGFKFTLISMGPRDQRSMEMMTAVPGADVIIAQLQAPGHRIELIKFISPAETTVHDIKACDQGFSHLAFDVTDIDEALAIAKSYGFTETCEPLPVSAGPNIGKFCVYLIDVDGLAIELIGGRNAN